MLSIIVFVLSFFGLPWVCGATVQSLNHVRSMANVRSISDIRREAENAIRDSNKKDRDELNQIIPIDQAATVTLTTTATGAALSTTTTATATATTAAVAVAVSTVAVTVSASASALASMNDKERRISDINSGKGNGGGNDVFSDVIETRLTGFVIHASILFSLLLLPFLGNIPIPVISGIFLYLGKKMMKGNLFLERLGCTIIEKKLLPSTNVFNLLPTLTVMKYLTIQSFMLLLIWVMKQNKNFSLFFPSCIAFLMIVRTYVMPKFFSKTDLMLLDPAM